MSDIETSTDGDMEDGEYIVLPEEAIQFLPAEWRDAFQAHLDDGRAVLEAVDSDMKNLARLIAAFQVMASLSYTHDRLSKTSFEPTIEWMFENDMLTSAFVVMYVRLIDGGIGTGVSRKALPLHLRKAHDEIVDLRNKRFAHNAGHHSIDGAIEVGFDKHRFEISAQMKMGYYVGGAKEWGELVIFLNGLMYDRLTKLLERLREKTGYEWTFPHGPPPSWIEPQ